MGRYIQIINHQINSYTKSYTISLYYLFPIDRVEIGTSSNPCAETYPGPEAFSEIESKSMSRFLKSIPEKLTAYLAFHSFSQLLLIPFGHTNQRIDNYDDLMEIGKFSVKALSKRYSTDYTVGNVVDVICKHTIVCFVNILLDLFFTR